MGLCKFCNDATYSGCICNDCEEPLIIHYLYHFRKNTVGAYPYKCNGSNKKLVYKKKSKGYIDLSNAGNYEPEIYKNIIAIVTTAQPAQDMSKTMIYTTEELPAIKLITEEDISPITGYVTNKSLFKYYLTTPKDNINSIVSIQFVEKKKLELI